MYTIVGYLAGTTHQWLDVECSHIYNYFVCNEDCHVPTTIPTLNPTPETSSRSASPTELPTDPSSSSTTIPTQEPTANCEQIGYDDTYCIYGVECINAINQSVAESYCENYYGTTLASIHSSTENNAGHSTVGGNVGAWIGLSWSTQVNGLEQMEQILTIIHGLVQMEVVMKHVVLFVEIQMIDGQIENV